jgi:hypothetical protein
VTRVRPLAGRFWEKVEKTDTCWLWGKCITSGGYGRLKVGGRTVLAHRVAYELEVGPIPDGLQLDHVRARGCANKHCVNPAHLEPVTPGLNTRRGTAPAATNARKIRCKRGHAFTPENTYIRQRTPIRSERSCRTCKNIRRARTAS